MKREEAIKWLKVINKKEFGWDEFALQESQREIRERCEQGVREAIDMAIEALQMDDVVTIQTGQTYGKSAYIKELAEVVRCKDCLKRDNSCGMGEHKWCKFLKQATSPYDYCSYGERREESEVEE